jgi:uncharacterized protein YggU (UPF0235/DUF167 family)
VTAPPVDHAANEAAITALGRALDVPPRYLAITAGLSSRNKLVEVRGVPVDVLITRLRPLCDGP